MNNVPIVPQVFATVDNVSILIVDYIISQQATIFVSFNDTTNSSVFTQSLLIQGTDFTNWTVNNSDPEQFLKDYISTNLNFVFA
jgi:hypothetical protein